MAEQGAMELIYFPIKGRAVSIRSMLKHANIEFTDTHIQMADWGQTKPTTVWGSLPMLKVGDQTLTQTRAIARYVAKKCNLYPEDDVQACHADALWDASEDVADQLLKVVKGANWANDEDKKAGLAKIIADWKVKMP